ncbi:Maternal effect protein oskar [Frankliniella fusca]|nr:Maternal effect protein oskar [Frankliniella fusca]
MAEKKTVVMLLEPEAAINLIREQLTPTRQRQAKPQSAKRSGGPKASSSSGKSSRGSKPQEKPKPMWNEYQLVGDSLMGRLAVKLGHKVPYNNHVKAKQLGLIRHGQTTNQLLSALYEKQKPLASQTIVMIGTNDILKDSNVALTKRNIIRIIQYLADKCKKVIIITLPPIPALKEPSKLTEELNVLIVNTALEHKNVKVCDISKEFVNDQMLRADLYEEYYKGSKQIDRIHWNSEGMDLVLDSLKKLF